MESDKQTDSGVSAGARSHDHEGQTGEDGCYIENRNQHAACLPTILESGLIFPFPSGNVALILEEKDTLKEESSNYPGKGFMESGFINQGRERNVDVEIIPQNACVNQGDTDQGMKAEKSTVEPAGNSSIYPYTFTVVELPIGGTQLETDVDPSEDNMEEFRSDTACAPVTSFPDTYIIPCKLTDGHKAVTMVTEPRNEINFDNENFRKFHFDSNFMLDMMEDQTKLYKPAFSELCTQCVEVKIDFSNDTSTASSRNCLQDYEINNEVLSSEEKNYFLQPGNLQEATQHADALTAFYTEKKEFQNPEQQLEELGVEEDQQMHEIHDSKDKECCSNPGPSTHVDQNQISSSVVSKQSVHQVTDSGNDCRAHVSLGSETVTILEYRQKYLHQDRCQDFNDYYSKKISKCTDKNVAGKDYLTQSSHGQDQKIQIRGPALVDCTRHCHSQSSNVQSEIAQSASHTSCTREEPKLDSEMSLQVPSQLIGNSKIKKVETCIEPLSKKEGVFWVLVGSVNSSKIKNYYFRRYPSY